MSLSEPTFSLRGLATSNLVLQATNTLENGTVLLKCKIARLGFLRLELGTVISTYASSGTTTLAPQTQL